MRWLNSINLNYAASNSLLIEVRQQQLFAEFGKSFFTNSSSLCFIVSDKQLYSCLQIEINRNFLKKH